MTALDIIIMVVTIGGVAWLLLWKLGKDLGQGHKTLQEGLKEITEITERILVKK